MITLEASSLRSFSFIAGSVALTISSSILPAFLRTNAPNIKGLSIPATLLQIPMILILFAALSIGPIILMYGLLAVCNNASPVP